jgi:arylsulfatase A-like enzyme
VPPETFLRRKMLHHTWPLHYQEYDELAMNMALASLWAFDPRVLMINLPGCDTYGHSVGGPAQPEVMKKLVIGCDQQLGRLITAYRDRGILDETIFVVVGDHGMVPNTFQVTDTQIKAAIRAAGGDLLFQTGGNSLFIWLRNPEVAPVVAQHIVSTIPHVPFAHYQTIESGTAIYHPVLAPGQVADPALEVAYEYLLGTMAGPLAPDISLAFVENMVVRNAKQGNLSATHGNHSGATWGVQHVPLVMAGPGIKQGVELDFPARLMDVAPTVLRLLGIEPTRMDGLVLSQALVRPAAADQRSYDAMAPILSAYQQALARRSQSDILSERSTD